MRPLEDPGRHLADAACEQKHIRTYVSASMHALRETVMVFARQALREPRRSFVSLWRAVLAAARVFVWCGHRPSDACIGRLIMPPGAHLATSAPHVCHWHTGCNKRFSSKRQLHRHLEQEHGLKRDAKMGWRATGAGARARRREDRQQLRARPRSPLERHTTTVY